MSPISCETLVLQYEPDTDIPEDLTADNKSPPEAETFTMEFYPVDPYQPMQIGGLEVEFCTHPSKTQIASTHFSSYFF